MLTPLSVRARLTLWYLAVTSAGLLLFGMLSFGALRFALLQVKRASVMRREQRLLLFLQEDRQSHLAISLTEQFRNYATITHEGNLFQLRTPEGNLIFPTDPAAAAWLIPPRSGCIRPVFTMQRADGEPIIVMCHLILMNGHVDQLFLGSSLDDNLHILGIYRNALLLLLPCLLGLSAISGYLLSRHALKPVDRMTKAAVNMGIANLSARLPVPEAHDELRDLALAWNQLLHRLQEAVSRLSQFSTDVSHDLRTSITVILATAQLSLHRHRDEEEYRDDLNRIAIECRTASTLLDALLSLARSETFVHEVAFRRINICTFVIAGCRRVEDLAENSGILLDWSLPGGDTYIEGDELLLHRLLGILLDNAIKYTPEYGQIRVEVSTDSSQVVVAVRDTGIGMSAEVCQHIFDRFYQADLRERKNQAGSGLGLSIARWIADAHRAELTVESIPARGSVFQIRFPAASRPHAAAAREQLAQ